MTPMLTAEQLRTLINFHKTDRANRRNMKPIGKIVADPKEMAKNEPPGIVSKAYVVRGKRRHDRDTDEQEDASAKE
ncbi:MAG: hypothetical protein OXG23_13210 [Chloroflexi bacterium]|nr:hypothetical protein [Chloroflexota bacterium]